MNKANQSIKNAIREVEKALVEKRYEDIGSGKTSSVLSATDIERAVQEYGGVVTFAPDETYQKLLVGEVKDSNPKQYWCDFEVWIDGKQSDLTLLLTISENNDKYLVSVDAYI